MKFDVIIGNPPYQKDVGKAGGGVQIWQKFVERAFEVCKAGGQIALVHPTMWRLGNAQSQGVNKLLTGHKLKYLNMNSVGTGLKVFGAGTSFDYYLVENTKGSVETEVVAEDGTVYHKNLAGLPFIPSAHLDFFSEIIAKPGEETVDFLYHTKYPNTKLTLEPTDTHVHPVVYSIKRDGVNVRYIDYNDRGIFGVPKVIFSNGGGNLLIDHDGTYGTTNFTWSIASDSEEDRQAIYDFFMRPDVRQKLKEAKASINLIEKGLIRALRKDFWKPRQ